MEESTENHFAAWGLKWRQAAPSVMDLPYTAMVMARQAGIEEEGGKGLCTELNPWGVCWMLSSACISPAICFSIISKERSLKDWGLDVG